MPGPLSGLLVADFSRVLAGCLDEERHRVEAVNRGKLSVTWDLTDPGDLAKARALAGRADVLVENFLTGTMAKFGLAYADVRAINPGIIYASVTGFGSGAGAALPGYDFVAQAIGGLMSITGEPAGEGQKAGVALVDVLTGKDATIGILAALAARERTGVGEHIEVNLLSSLLGSLVNQASGYLTTGVAAKLRQCLIVKQVEFLQREYNLMLVDHYPELVGLIPTGSREGIVGAAAGHF